MKEQLAFDHSELVIGLGQHDSAKADRFSRRQIFRTPFGVQYLLPVGKDLGLARFGGIQAEMKVHVRFRSSKPRSCVGLRL